MAIRTVLSLCILFAAVAVARADDKADQKVKEGDFQKAVAAAQKIQENPQKLNKFFGERFGRASAALRGKKYDEVEATLNEIDAVVNALTPEAAGSKQWISRAKSAARNYRNQIVLGRTTLEDLKKKFAASPKDAQTLNQVLAKVNSEVGPLTRSAPDKAAKKVAEFTAFLTKVKESADDVALKSRIDKAAQRYLSSWNRAISSGKKLAALIGKEAAPLKFDVWANGKPLTDADVKGKVVLLDFWAVWCGPCIATFPHLREWQEKYADKDFVIIGVTSYYNYSWDDAAGRIKRETVKPSQQAYVGMLEKFAEHHKLHHAFAVQGGDRSLSKYYGVSGIPQAVVIDQEGKVQLVRVGSGPANAKDISDKLEELLK